MMAKATTKPTSAPYDDLIKLDQMLKDAKASKHDRVLALIEICIERGVDQGARITSALETLGFNKRHVGILLHELSGPALASNRWVREGDRYKLHTRENS